MMEGCNAEGWQMDPKSEPRRSEVNEEWNIVVATGGHERMRLADGPDRSKGA